MKDNILALIDREITRAEQELNSERKFPTYKDSPKEQIEILDYWKKIREFADNQLPRDDVVIKTI